MQKIIVIGCPGAGKSTFSRALRDKTGLPLFYLDMIWHKEDKTNVSREEFDQKLGRILDKEKWIIDGNYRRTLETRLNACDTVFFLDFSTEICIDGARERVGKVREDMPWVEENLDEEFIKFIEKFRENELPRIYSLMKKCKDKKIVIFKSRKDMQDYINSL